jgi:hypothetical protein
MNIEAINRSEYFRDRLSVNENSKFDIFSYCATLAGKVPFVHSITSRGIFKYSDIMNSLEKKFNCTLVYRSSDMLSGDHADYMILERKDNPIGTIMLSLAVDFYSLSADDEDFDEDEAPGGDDDSREEIVEAAFLYYDPADTEVVNDIGKIWKEEEFTIEDSPYVRILVKNGDDLDLREFPITSGYDMKEPDLHYGEGFAEFHTAMLKRISSRHDGLVMLHGLPGTGKSFYIRALMKELIKAGKDVVYIPPSFIGALADPGLITFFTDWVSGSSKKIILLIEDCEELFVARQADGFDGRNTAMANLLNLTQGILNDILKVQVIATFNTELQNIDKALLRPERLIARKQFDNLTPDTANKLAKLLKTGKNYTEDVSLAEIYSTKNNREILTHSQPKPKVRIGFN